LRHWLSPCGASPGSDRRTGRVQPRTRTVPLLTDASIHLGKPKELALNLKFRNPAGSPTDASFLVYLGYTDNNMMFKDKSFASPYGHFWNPPLFL
jgi:hypothetical protein